MQRPAFRAATDAERWAFPHGRPWNRWSKTRSMMFAIKVEVSDPRAKTFAFTAQKTMYGGKHIAEGDTIFIFASENEGGPGLIASGVVTSAKAIARRRGIARQTPRVSITIRRTGLAKRRLGRSDLKTLFRLERRSTRDRTQLQILSSGNEQDRRHLRRSGGIPPRVLLTRPISSMTRYDLTTASTRPPARGARDRRVKRSADSHNHQPCRGSGRR